MGNDPAVRHPLEFQPAHRALEAGESLWAGDVSLFMTEASWGAYARLMNARGPGWHTFSFTTAGVSGPQLLLATEVPNGIYKILDGTHLAFMAIDSRALALIPLPVATALSHGSPDAHSPLTLGTTLVAPNAGKPTLTLDGFRWGTYEARRIPS